MSSWYQNHPWTSVVAHTILVAATTGAAFVFLFDSNKVEAARAESEQYKAKISTLESEVSQLRGDRDRYLWWLSTTPCTFPSLETKIADLSKENQELRAAAGVHQVTPNISTLAGRGATLSIGETFVDDVTGFTVGLLGANKDFTANVLLVLPGGERKELESVKAGERWGFNYKNVSYQAQLRNVDWYANKATIAIRESGS